MFGILLQYLLNTRDTINHKESKQSKNMNIRDDIKYVLKMYNLDLNTVCTKDDYVNKTVIQQVPKKNIAKN